MKNFIYQFEHEVSKGRLNSISLSQILSHCLAVTASYDKVKYMSKQTLEILDIYKLRWSLAMTQVDLPETTSASLGPQVTKPHVIVTVFKWNKL